MRMMLGDVFADVNVRWCRGDERGIKWVVALLRLGSVGSGGIKISYGLSELAGGRGVVERSGVQQGGRGRMGSKFTSDAGSVASGLSKRRCVYQIYRPRMAGYGACMMQNGNLWYEC